MAQHRLNLKAIKEVKDLFNAGWIYRVFKNDEIIIETKSIDEWPAVLKIYFICLCEGILNSGLDYEKNEGKDRIEYDSDNIEFKDYNVLANELTKVTGIKFSVEIIN